MGRTIDNLNLALKRQCADATSFTPEDPLGEERDGCVGNGGMGCPATCYLSSGASQELPTCRATGCATSTVRCVTFALCARGR